MSETGTAKLLEVIQLQSLNAVSNAISASTRSTAVELYKALDKASDWLRTDYSIAINLLEANDEWLAAQVCASIKDIFNKYSAGSGKPVNISAKAKASTAKTASLLSSLSLVSKDEFEDWLNADVAAKYLEAEIGYEVNEIRQIFQRLHATNYNLKDCPLSPHSLFRSIKAAIDKLEIPTTPQATIYKQYSRQLEMPLRELYNAIIQYAQTQGVVYKDAPAKHAKPSNTVRALDRDLVEPIVTTEPRPENKLRDEPVSAHGFASGYQKPQINMLEQSSSSQPSALSRSLVNQETTARQSIQTLNALSSLNTRVARSGTNAQTDISGAHFDSDYLLTAISLVQQAQVQTDDLSDKKLRSWLESGLNDCPDAQCTIGDKESELIDVTDRFFEVIIEKVGVSGLLKKWLDKLKVTILKVVLRDKSFFSDVSHPARQMLNKLAKLASSDRTDHKRLEKVLDRFIDRVVVEYDDDDTVIERVVVELDQLLERQSQAYKRNSERIARAYEGKQKVADARYRVTQDLNALLTGCSVPVVLLELLDKAGWREHLALVSVRDGHDSEQYEDVFKVADLLLSWLGEESDQSDKWALELEMELEGPSLVALIRKELSISGLIGYESILKHLEECLYEDVQPLLVNVEHYEWPYDKTEKEIEALRPGQDQDTQTGYWHKRIMSMKVGDWLEIKDDKGRARCMRLAWAGRSSFRFVFVDSQGMKDEDVSLNDLVASFKNNRAGFVDHEDVPLVDQGLHQMVQTVYEELATQSSCDVLTGLLNRQAFERGLQQSISGALSKKSSMVLLYIDLDKFSLTNASYGHHAGDALLKHVAQIIRTHSSEDVFCGRLGGNEFGMILNQCSAEPAKAVGRTICESLEKTPFVWEDHQISSSVSIGLAEFDAEADSSDTLMRKASLACDLAKQQGRNRVLMYQEKDDDQKKRQEMLRWVNYLDGDLDELLTLRCQEIRPIDVSGKEKPHYEILLGVKQEGQVLPPGLLIEAAEHFNRMSKVDRWVIHNVLLWIEAHPGLAAKSSGFSINLSGNSLNDDHFLEFLLGQFAISSVPPEMICFEITETAAITSLSDATEFIRVLKKTGCKFALDDFGAGLSSYAYIQKLPVDFIKIDGIFIRNIATNLHDQALVKSINELAHFMGMKTVAEFVESHEILAVLRKIGVDHAQGFGIKKPMLLSDLGSYMILRS